MSDSRSARLSLALVLVGLGLSPMAQAEPPSPPPARARDDGEAVKPRPLPPIPDDPPPHEGALIDLPYTVDASDLVLVEVLEALPGRPISGERLVRPDGTISLGFYGDLYVRGLTTRQIKEKIVLHLRKILSDQALGLVEFNEYEEVPSPGAKEKDAPEEKNGEERRPASTGEPRGKSARVRPRATVIRPVSQPEPSRPKPLTAPPSEVKEAPTTAPPPPPSVPENGQFYAIDPADSQKVFVDITAFNSKYYYVQGDVAQPGRLPWTGQETVLDAMNYAGGLIPSADPGNIRLVRPGRGDAPAKVYKIDLKAITDQGKAKVNYQLFPGDRLLVGRNPLIKSTIVIDHLAASLASVAKAMDQYVALGRSLSLASNPPEQGGASLPREKREALLDDWMDLLRKVVAGTQGEEIDEDILREALMRKLRQAEQSRPAGEKR